MTSTPCSGLNSLPDPESDGGSVTVDCDSCVVRGLSCHDCVVSALLGPPEELTFGENEQAAIAVLAETGLVPPLRMVSAWDGPQIESA